MALVHFELIRKKKGGGILMLPTSHSRQNNMMITHKGKLRELRYCLNESSVWKDEQNENSVSEIIILRGNSITVNEDRDPNLVEFLRLAPYNGVKYKEIDLELEASKKVVEEELHTEAKYLIMKADKQTLESLSKIYNPHLEVESIDLIKERLYEKAENDPQSIINNLTTEKATMDIEAIAVAVIGKGVIGESEDNKELIWVKGGATLTTKHHKKNAVKALTEFLSDPENEATLKELKSKA